MLLVYEKCVYARHSFLTPVAVFLFLAYVFIWQRLKAPQCESYRSSSAYIAKTNFPDRQLIASGNSRESISSNARTSYGATDLVQISRSEIARDFDRIKGYRPNNLSAKLFFFFGKFQIGHTHCLGRPPHRLGRVGVG